MSIDVILDWTLVEPEGRFVCRICEEPARKNPDNPYQWGCPNHGATLELIEGQFNIAANFQDTQAIAC